LFHIAELLEAEHYSYTDVKCNSLLRIFTVCVNDLRLCLTLDYNNYDFSFFSIAARAKQADMIEDCADVTMTMREHQSSLDLKGPLSLCQAGAGSTDSGWMTLKSIIAAVKGVRRTQSALLLLLLLLAAGYCVRPSVHPSIGRSTETDIVRRTVALTEHRSIWLLPVVSRGRTDRAVRVRPRPNWTKLLTHFDLPCLHHVV